jgi:Protein of unknown function (DUF3631)
VRRGKERMQTAGAELLQHILEAFIAYDTDRLWTEKLLGHLHNRDESPWADIRGKPLSDRGLSERLRHYGIKSRQIRIGELNHNGYLASSFCDNWSRYLEPAWAELYKVYKVYKTDNKNKNVEDVEAVEARAGNGTCQACDGNYGQGCPTCKPENYGLPPKKRGVKPAVTPVTDDYPELPEYLRRKSEQSGAPEKGEELA